MSQATGRIDGEYAASGPAPDHTPQLTAPGSTNAGRVRRWWVARPWLIDSLVAVVYLCGALWVAALAFIDDLSFDSLNAVPGIVVSLATTVAILFRRRATMWMTAIVLVLGFATMLQEANANFLSFPIMLYSVTVFRSVSRAWLSCAVVVAMVIASPFLPWADPLAFTDFVTPLILVVGSVVGILVGMLARGRQQYQAALIERAAYLEREQETTAQLAAANERTRIAREMHDIISHTLTVVITLSEGAIAAKDESVSKSTMTAAAKAARGALNDVRGLLGALRGDSGAPLHPEADSEELPLLVDRYLALGVPVSLEVSGTPSEGAAVRLAIIRIVREALTNVLRYSEKSTRVAVRVDYRADAVDVSVENDGARANAVSVGTGQGLFGLRERISILGGTLEAGPRGPGLWRVHASIPLPDEDSPEPTDDAQAGVRAEGAS